MEDSMPDSLETATSTLYPVMNFTSSMAKMLEGSAMAMVSVAPTRATGMIVYLRAISTGTSFTTAPSISYSVRLMAGTPNCLLRKATSFSSVM